MSTRAPKKSIDVVLLKTKSTPADNYEDYFRSLTTYNYTYTPTFIPVLEHRFRESALHQVRTAITSRAFSTSKSTTAPYGGLIFTSQRAVEAFTHVIEALRADPSLIDLTTVFTSHLPFYVVGPATARGLRALNLPCPILGEETGDGHTLAQFILADYPQRYTSGASLPSLLFLVGKTRRDIIPATMASAAVPLRELVVYETGERAPFQADLTRTWRAMEDAGAETLWVVVFSPAGSEAVLDTLRKLGGEDGRPTKGGPEGKGRMTARFAAIGPTTRDHLRETFEMEPDVCAEVPSPAGVGEAISAFMERGHGKGVESPTVQQQTEKAEQ